MEQSSKIFTDPISYLKPLWSVYGISPGAEWDPKLDIKTNWWNGITRKPEETPMCDRCQNDTKEYSRLRAEMSLEEFMKDHMKCCHHCLWFQWFHQQRLKMSSENSNKTEVSKKLKNKSKNGK
jgi:hypothetical protein